MILVVDNFDSFTWNLVDYLLRTGEKVELVRNDVHPDDYNFQSSIKGILLSPGPGRPETAGHLLQIIDIFHQKVPLLGICLGHQAIGMYCGAKLIKAPLPMHGKISNLTFNNSDPLFRGITKPFNVVRYHSLILSDIPESIHVTAQTDGLTMALSHKKFPMFGIQFHPEAHLTEFGPEIIKNWVNYCMDYSG